MKHSFKVKKINDSVDKNQCEKVWNVKPLLKGAMKSFCAHNVGPFSSFLLVLVALFLTFSNPVLQLLDQDYQVELLEKDKEEQSEKESELKEKRSELKDKSSYLFLDLSQDFNHCRTKLLSSAICRIWSVDFQHHPSGIPLYIVFCCLLLECDIVG